MEILDETQKSDSNSIETEWTESYFNALPRVIETLTHKWTIDSFEALYRDEWPIESIQSNNFSPKSNDKLKFYLDMYPNGYGEENKGHLSIYLWCISEESAETNVRFKFSIIDSENAKYNTKGLILYCRLE